MGRGGSRMEDRGSRMLRCARIDKAFLELWSIISEVFVSSVREYFLKPLVFSLSNGADINKFNDLSTK